jgi:predicted Co/Zn/Cd cation transporter (cation efflux family)
MVKRVRGIYRRRNELVNCLVAILALQVTQLAQRRSDARYPFGYAVYEPMLNLLKGLVVLTAEGFALVTSIDALIHGGRPLSTGAAVIYSLIAANGCLGMALRQRRLADRGGSPFLQVDARTWWVDGLLSGEVEIAFIAVFLLRQSPWAFLLPYVDPGIVSCFSPSVP